MDRSSAEGVLVETSKAPRGVGCTAGEGSGKGAKFFYYVT